MSIPQGHDRPSGIHMPLGEGCGPSISMINRLLPYTVIGLMVMLPGKLRADSLVVRKNMIAGELSGSYVVERDPWTGEQASMSLKFLVEGRRRRGFSLGRSSDHQFLTTLGYVTQRDSIWLKSNDQFRLIFRWNNRINDRYSRSWNVMIQSQWLDSRMFREGRFDWTGGFLNPLRLEAAYGFSRQFMKSGSLVLTPATIQVQVMPSKMMRTGAGDDRPFMTVEGSHVFTRYGFNGLLTIDESFFEGVLVWRNQSRFFMNAISSSHVQFDVHNRVCIRFLKVLQLRLDTVLQYAPETSLRLQYRQEVLLGVFYENKR